MFSDIHRNRRLARRRALLAALLAAPMLGPAAFAQQPGPTDPAAARIRTFCDALLATMRQADKLGVRGRYEKLEPAIRATFDLPAMTRIAVGPKWSSIPAEEQAKLVDAFSRWTIATYADRFDGYSGERFEVDPTSEQRPTGRVVHTKIVPSSGAPTELDYLMRGSGNDWRIVDVYLTGAISELATRRAEFAAVLAAGGVPALIRRLDDQAQRLLAAQAAKT